MNDLLEITDLCVQVDGQELLHGVDLSIPEGQIHALLGPNGSGKTSLMMVSWPNIPIRQAARQDDSL